jgi:GntR family transcriptional regulator
MKMVVSNMSQTPIYEQIENQIKEMILTGQLKAGEQLPSIRILAKDLKIGIVTCRRAYDDLCEEGFLISHPGKGVFVAEVNREQARNIYRQVLKDQLKDVCEYAKNSGFCKKDVIDIVEEIYEERESEG